MLPLCHAASQNMLAISEVLFDSTKLPLTKSQIQIKRPVIQMWWPLIKIWRFENVIQCTTVSAGSRGRSYKWDQSPTSWGALHKIGSFQNVPTVGTFINKLKLNLLTNVPTVGTFQKRPILWNAPLSSFLSFFERNGTHSVVRKLSKYMYCERSPTPARTHYPCLWFH